MKGWQVYMLVCKGFLRRETRIPNEVKLHISFASELNLRSMTKLRNLGDQEMIRVQL
jgi:hypothetical protein